MEKRVEENGFTGEVFKVIILLSKANGGLYDSGIEYAVGFDEEEEEEVGEGEEFFSPKYLATAVETTDP